MVVDTVVGTRGQGPVQGVVVVVVVVVVPTEPPPHTSLPSRKAPMRLGLEEKPSTIRTLNMPPEEMPWLLLIVQVLEIEEVQAKGKKTK